MSTSGVSLGLMAAGALAMAGVTGLVGFCWWVWRQNQGLRGVLNEGARAFDALERRAKNLEDGHKILKMDLAAAKRRESEVRASATELSDQLAQAGTELALKTADFERRFHNVEIQRDHILTQHGLVSSALKRAIEIEAEQKVSLDLMRYESSQLKSAAAKESAEAQSRLVQKLRFDSVELRKKITDLERDLREARGRTDINPRDFDTLRRKVGQYEMLYTGMKSQRDMAGERNKNWEGALARLANWILTKSSVAIPNDPILAHGVGPVVGEALSRIGEALIDVDQQGEFEAEALATAAADALS
ncbi:MAG: hypothetical protein NTV34_03795 [Proteobacteria bacterium]|nr:hypothetical protein [Pseudomonadota bacterium]